MSARLVSATMGTLTLPRWPELVTRNPSRQQWTDIERPGRTPLQLSTGLSLKEYQISYLAGGEDLVTAMAAHVALLELMAGSMEPVTLMLESTDRGLFHLGDLSIAEVRHAGSGEPDSIDVSLTLRQASEVTILVGPVAPVATPPAVVAATGGPKSKTLTGARGKASVGI